MDPGLLGQHQRQFAAAPLGGKGTMLKGVLIDQTIEMLFQRARDFGWSTRARAISQAPGPLLRKALHPLTEGRIS